MKNLSIAEVQESTEEVMIAVERGEHIVVHREGKPIATISPCVESTEIPSWKRPFTPIKMSGKPLSQIIIEERGAWDEDFL